MIEDLLPAEVAVVETRVDLLAHELFPEEQALLQHAVEKRRREFVTARACAHRALQKLGLPAQPIGSGERGEPLWPKDVVGSITHCEGYRACALAHTGTVATIGIDAEPNAPLPDGVFEEIARPEERPGIDQLHRVDPAVCWDRLLFSAKESVYKAWFPLTQRWLGFEDASIQIDCAGGAFSARLLVEGPTLGDREFSRFSGRWLVRDGLVLTAIAPVRAVWL